MRWPESVQGPVCGKDVFHPLPRVFVQDTWRGLADHGLKVILEFILGTFLCSSRGSLCKTDQRVSRMIFNPRIKQCTRFFSAWNAILFLYTWCMLVLLVVQTIGFYNVFARCALQPSFPLAMKVVQPLPKRWRRFCIVASSLLHLLILLRSSGGLLGNVRPSQSIKE